MRLKQLAQLLLIGCSVIALGACTPKQHGSSVPAAVYDANACAGGAQASGLGEEENFGGPGEMGGGAHHGLHQRIYYFDFDSYVVHDEDKSAIYANADYLVAHPRAKIIIEGHTDPRGSREYNVALAEKRANAVSELLTSKGVNTKQIRVVSYGAERLAVPGRSEHDYQLDRRAVIVYQQR